MPDKKKVLIITYYWPPAGGSPVLRWLKFSRYLGKFGWEPVIYTVENGEYAESDPANEKDIPEGLTVLKQTIWEPYLIYKHFIGQKKIEKVNVGFLSEKKKPKLTEKISVWIRGNFFIPDARKFWIKPSIRHLTEWLIENPVDVIISTGPPHSMHLIAMELKNRFHIPWIADFRDPWTKIDFYHELNLTWLADKKHKSLEKKVITSADCIIVIGNQMKKEFSELGALDVKVISNGFDDDDIKNISFQIDIKFSLAHFGTINKARNPIILWQVLSDLINEIPTLANDLEINFIGRTDHSVIDSIEKYELKKYVNKTGFVSHSEALKIQLQTQVLLLLINQSHNAGGILTNKFFEYLAAKRPILAIGPTHGDIADILLETKAGKIVDFNDYENLKSAILEYYKAYKNNSLTIIPKGIDKYSRYELTRQLSEVLNGLI